MINITVDFKKGHTKKFDDVSCVQIGRKVAAKYSGEEIFKAIFKSNEDITITCPSGVYVIASGTFELISVERSA